MFRTQATLKTEKETLASARRKLLMTLARSVSVGMEVGLQWAEERERTEEVGILTMVLRGRIGQEP